MHASFRCTGIVNQIDARHDAQARTEEYRRVENRFVVGLARGAMIAAEVDEILLKPALFDVGIELVQVERVVEERIMLVPLVDDAPPRRPARYAERGGKEIVVGHVLGFLVVVDARNHTDARVVFVAVEHLLAEREKRLRGHIVILQHNALVGHAESPLLRQKLRGVATVVFLLIQALHLALPVDLLVAHDLPTSLDSSHVALASRPVLIEK